MTGRIPPEIPPSELPASMSTYGTELRKLYVFLAGAVYGMVMRLGFGLYVFIGTQNRPRGASDASGVMLASFVILVPLVIGGLTVFYSGGRRRTFAYALVAPWVPILLFIAGTAVLLIEGSICIVMATPIFIVMSSLGGIAMWAVLKFVQPSPAIMPSLLALPLLLGAWEGGQPIPALIATSDASVTIAAKPEAIWNLINDAHDIRPDEMRDGLAWRIGVPYPQSALTVDTAQGRVRKLQWDMGVRFDEPITDWQENRYIRWNYSFPPGAIPPNALDEHVTIGGRYFDLIDTSYKLTPARNGTRLDIHVTYRVSTDFNWYSGLLGRVLVDDAARQILGFYKHRAEAAPHSVVAS